MKVKTITLEGETNYTATISRGTSPEEVQSTEIYIIVEIRDAEGELVNMHLVSRDDQADQFSMAECMQYMLDGCKGTNSMIHDFYMELQRFAN